jgi:hypothetical protein
VATGRVSSDKARAPADDDAVATAAATLVDRGLALVPGRWPDHASAWEIALQIAAAARDLDPLSAGLPDLEVVGKFTLPPPGVLQRDFQALHIDYGVPRLAGPPVAVARFTALYLDSALGSAAATRIVPLRRLLSQRSWPASEVLAGRLCDEAGDGDLVEGILARVIEAADQSEDLPDKDADGFLCGMEFLTLDEEQRYFARHGLSLAAAEKEIVLGSGQLLLFDNIAVGHGRRGRRNPGELHQLCIGFGSLDLIGQVALLNRFLSAFERGPGHEDAVTAPAEP